MLVFLLRYMVMTKSHIGGTGVEGGGIGVILVMLDTIDRRNRMGRIGIRALIPDMIEMTLTWKAVLGVQMALCIDHTLCHFGLALALPLHVQRAKIHLSFTSMHHLLGW